MRKEPLGSSSEKFTSPNGSGMKHAHVPPHIGEEPKKSPSPAFAGWAMHRLVDAGAGDLDGLGPLRDFLLHEGLELLRRRGRELAAGRDHFFFRLGI